MANGIDGKTHISLDTVIKAVAGLIGLTVFVLTMKFTQESQNARIDNLTVEVSALRAEVKELRTDQNDWKRATTGLLFTPRKARPNEVNP